VSWLWGLLAAAFNGVLSFFVGGVVKESQIERKRAEDELEDYKLAKKIKAYNSKLSDSDLNRKL